MSNRRKFLIALLSVPIAASFPAQEARAFAVPLFFRIIAGGALRLIGRFAPRAGAQAAGRAAGRAAGGAAAGAQITRSARAMGRKEAGKAGRRIGQQIVKQNAQDALLNVASLDIDAGNIADVSERVYQSVKEHHAETLWLSDGVNPLRVVGNNHNPVPVSGNCRLFVQDVLNNSLEREASLPVYCGANSAFEHEIPVSGISPGIKRIVGRVEGNAVIDLEPSGIIMVASSEDVRLRGA